MRIFLVTLMMLFCVPAFADRIVSDPFPLTGIVQPTTCRAAYDGSTVFTGFSVLKNADNSVYCSVTIPTLPPGSHVASIKACVTTSTGAFDCSDPPTQLNFTVAAPVPVGPPPAPLGLKIVP